MKRLQVFHLLILILWLLTTELTEALSLAKNGCDEKCGNVRIPFPFGIGAHCSLNEWYVVDCNSSTPYLSAFDNAEVLNVSLVKQTITVNVSIIFDCQKRVYQSSQILKPSNGFDGSLNPFLFCNTYNIFLVEGCGNAVIENHGTIVAGCSSTCNNETLIERKNCFGLGCCKTTIPYHLRNFTLNLMGMERQGESGSCGSAFLLDKSSYFKENFSPKSIARDGRYFVPISFLWPLTLLQESEVSSFEHPECTNLQLLIGERSLENYTKCECSATQEGNPYLPNGCRESDECKRCKNAGGLCERRAIYDDLNSQRIWLTGCNYDFSYHQKTSLPVILGVGISMGLLFIMTVIYALYKIIKKTIEKRQREKFFKRNGGQLLKQQEANDSRFVNKTILFRSKELEKATDHFNENRIIGRGGQGTVFKGMLTDGRIVAIKKSKVVDESQIKHFINEVVVLSQVNHRNIVKLLGCCLETEVPLLVSEFIPNGTLYDLIQDVTGEVQLSLNLRLQIAIEVAGALSYLHSATSIPIYHRDIKTTNILLDDKYRAKVSDFGTSRFVSLDQTHVTTLVNGTFGYMDPEYFQSSQVTEKSDVYSFGVVLLELLTREKPISLTRFGETRSLVMNFVSAMEEGRVMSIFDSMIVKEGSRSELLALANLAMKCLYLNGKSRPTMKEVAIELESIRLSHVPSTLQINFEHIKYSEEGSMLTYGEPISSTTSFDSKTN